MKGTTQPAPNTEGKQVSEKEDNEIAFYRAWASAKKALLREERKDPEKRKDPKSIRRIEGIRRTLAGFEVMHKASLEEEARRRPFH
jgi:hypothetical protein